MNVSKEQILHVILILGVDKVLLSITNRCVVHHFDKTPRGGGTLMFLEETSWTFPSQAAVYDKNGEKLSLWMMSVASGCIIITNTRRMRRFIKIHSKRHVLLYVSKQEIVWFRSWKRMESMKMFPRFYVWNCIELWLLFVRMLVIEWMYLHCYFGSTLRFRKILASWT